MFSYSINSNDIISIGTNSFMYKQSSLRVQTLSGHISLTLLWFFVNLQFSLHYYIRECYQITAVQSQFVSNFIVMVAQAWYQ